MLFNSLEFILFLIITLVAFSLAPKKFRKYILLSASLYFYASWNVIYIFLIAFTTVISYVAGFLIGNGKNGKFFLYASIASSLSVLGVFKYGNFAIENLNLLIHVMTKEMTFNSLDFLLPVGISFYTFQAISYNVDVYRKKISIERNFLDYVLYITFFPQLVAGPIERADNILPQIKEKLECLPNNIVPGFTLILSGFFKKLVVADRLSIFVDKVYMDPGAHMGSDTILAFYFFAFQIYCDFSGYTDIARGVSRFFNLELMRNFNRPYFATSIQDFWRRWHISLSTWFRDYLYVPLGGNRNGRVRMLANIMIVFTLCGLWHGAAYTFIFWGLIHGVLLAGQHICDSFMSTLSRPMRIPRFLKIMITFHIVCILWVFFRANTMSDAMIILQSLIHLSDLNSLGDLIFSDYENLLSLVFIILLLSFEASPFKWKIENILIRRPAEVAFQIACFFLILAFGIFDTTTFIYFQF